LTFPGVQEWVYLVLKVVPELLNALSATNSRSKNLIPDDVSTTIFNHWSIDFFEKFKIISHAKCRRETGIVAIDFQEVSLDCMVLT